MPGRADPPASDRFDGATPASFVLASTSIVRRRLLEAAGLRFLSASPDLDEAPTKVEMTGAPAAEIAKALAVAKAVAVASRPELAESICVGADQILAVDDQILDKPRNLAEARETLLRLRGCSHRLVGAVALVRGNEVLWQYVGEATLRMRDFSDGFLDDYLEAEGEDICQSVGAYRLEARGAQLFSHIDGDYFSILGLPLLPLLAALRIEGIVAE